MSDVILKHPEPETSVWLKLEQCCRWVKPAQAEEANDKKKSSVFSVCLRSCGDACSSSIISWHQSHCSDEGGGMIVPALPKKKLHRDPGDLINLHSPPAALCCVPASLCCISSFHLSNETLCGKATRWLRSTQRACLWKKRKKKVPACMHAWASWWVRITWRHEHEPWVWRSHLKPTLLVQLHSWIQSKNTHTLRVLRRGE